MAQQEGNSDLSTKFSTLNVNAMEFVPSFCTNTPASGTGENEATAPTAAEAAGTPVKESAVESDNTPMSQDASPTKTNAEPPVSVTAATTEPIDDKSPDNPGMYSETVFILSCFADICVAKI